jgi:mannose-1-phosphate guanylyltransferase
MSTNLINNNVYVVILAGGSGTRFWPVSRQAKPKQFLALGATQESLIQSTARRIEPLLCKKSEKSLMVVTNKDLISQVRAHVPSAHVLSEPLARNTAASIGLAAIEVVRENPDGIMVILPADHSVSDESVLRGNLERAIEVAKTQQALVTVGIKPESPNTGYGYIQRGPARGEKSYEVTRFFEKPNLERAIDYCASGDFYWNSGMFVWKASVILEAFKEHMPKLMIGLEKINSAFGHVDFDDVSSEVFRSLDSVSIDFGVLEHAHNCMVVEALPFGWNDVGSWDAWAQHFEADSQGNVASGDVIQVQSKNCISYVAGGDKKVIALLGVEDLVVIDTKDALLLCNRNKVQEVKLIVDNLKKLGRTDLL